MQEISIQTASFPCREVERCKGEIDTQRNLMDVSTGYLLVKAADLQVVEGGLLWKTNSDIAT